MILVAGYGSLIRRDDLAGRMLAESVKGMPGVDVRLFYQLTPDLAHDLPSYDAVVFTDASSGGPPARFQKIRLSGDFGSSSHHCGARTLVALASTLFASAPPAFLFTVRGEDFSLGSDPTPIVLKRVRRASFFLRQWLERKVNIHA